VNGVGAKCKGGNITTSGNRSGGQEPRRPTYVLTSEIQAALRDGTANRHTRRAAKKLGITA
jgi:hypothetical protein